MSIPEKDGIELIQLRGETIAAKPANGIMPLHDPNCVVRLQIDDSRENLKIFMAVNVFEEILEYSKQDIAKELGGVLIGEYSRENKAEFIKISDFLPAKHTQNDGTYIKFTPETWSTIDVEMKAKRFWNKRIVGWHHTHPGWGVFLSEDDMFIQRNFFDLSWQVALVVDPIKNKQQIFVWNGENVVKTKEFYFYASKDNEQEAKSIYATEGIKEVAEVNHKNKDIALVAASLNKLWLAGMAGFFAGVILVWMILKV